LGGGGAGAGDKMTDELFLLLFFNGFLSKKKSLN